MFFKKNRPDAIVPTRNHPTDSGLDLYAVEDVTIEGGETKIVQTGISFSFDLGLEIQIRPRSGVSLKTPLRVANAPATIDFGYTGDCSVILWNSNPNVGYKIKRGDRIAQAVLCPVVIPSSFEEVQSLENTDRGEKGFGSSGT